MTASDRPGCRCALAWETCTVHGTCGRPHVPHVECGCGYGTANGGPAERLEIARRAYLSGARDRLEAALGIDRDVPGAPATVTRLRPGNGVDDERPDA